MVIVIKVTLSRKLGEIRMTQIDLSRKTGIRNATIYEIYHGYAERISLEHLNLICEALQCDVSEILSWVPNKEPRDALSANSAAVRCRTWKEKEERRFHKANLK